MDSTTKKFGRRYPWSEWLRRGQFSLHRGADFDIEPYSMQQLVRRAAHRSKVKVKVYVDGSRVDVIVTRDGRAA